MRLLERFFKLFDVRSAPETTFTPLNRLIHNRITKLLSGRRGLAHVPLCDMLVYHAACIVLASQGLCISRRGHSLGAQAKQLLNGTGEFRDECVGGVGAAFE